jgi:hypothetical protein
MKRILLLGLVGLMAQALSAAESGNKAASASKQLGEKQNYSWTMTTKEADGSSGRLGPVDGKADKGGLVYLTFSVSDVPVEVFMKGDKGAAKGLEGWQTFDDIAQTSGTAAAVVRFLRAYKTPVAQSADLAGKASDLKEVDGALTGDLKEDAVKDLLLMGGRRREGQDAPKIEGAKGSVKFWVKDGVLSKYETKVQGKVTAGDRENDINRTITVEIKDVGTTKLEVPDDAKQKLS